MADVSAALKDWSATSASNSPAGGATIGTGLDDNLREIQGAIVRGLSNKGADIASATTTDLGAVEGLEHDITGTTTITGFGTVRAGIWKIIKFEGALTLTHNATSLILPGAANITTADGDVAIVCSEGSGNWRCASYQRASGLAVLAADYGQAQLTYTDTTHVKLIPFNGNKLVVNGVVCTVPDAGVSYTISGLASSTLYYVYAVATTGAISSIEVSTTVPVASTTAGNKGTMIKTGDDTRSLVGMVRTDGSTLFADTVLQRFVRSWFNDGGVTCMGVLSGDVALSSSPWAALSSSTFLEFLAWSGESGHSDAGFNYIDTGGNGEILYSGIGLNSTSTPGNSQYSVITVDSTNYYKNGCASRSDRLSVGYNYYRIIYGIGGGATPFMSTGSGISCDIGR